ncbi:MAG TPA: M10 family metallopeptidase C-terminal domain-containing protein [Caulobacteraceae bacterium]|jgi:Ca2+-binding RTX toxin-like protein
MYIEGDDQANRLTGTAEADQIEGLGGDDTLIGRDGDDSLYGGDGYDVLLGGDGDDRVIDINCHVEGGAGDDDLNVYGASDVYGGDGRDILSASGDGTSAPIILDGGRGGDQVGALDAAYATLRGGGGDDSVSLAFNTSMAGDLLVDGGGGTDFLNLFFGRAHFSRIDLSGLAGGSAYVEEAGLTLSGFETGVVSFYRDARAVKVRIGDADLDVYTLRGNDTIVGGRADSVFHAGLGDDLLQGRGGADTLHGSLGDDTLDGGDGQDTAAYDFNKVHVDLALEGPQDTGEGLDTLRDIENLTGGQNSDVLLGDGGANVIADGEDEVFREDGADTLDGRGGDDVLIARQGEEQDQLRGGEGADRFVFDYSGAIYGPAARDRIMDLAAEDTIDLSRIDANVLTEGDDAFVLTDRFHGVAGEAVMRYRAKTDLTVLWLDHNGDGRADMTIVMRGDHGGFENLVL